MIKSLGSEGDVMVELSIGVGGYDVVATEAGREGSLVGGAIGRVSESRFVLRDAFDSERDAREKRSWVEGVGGGGVTASGVSISPISVSNWASEGLK